MALQLIVVDDAAPGECVDAGVTYNGTDTLTYTSDVVASNINVTTLTSAGNTNLTGNLEVNTDKFVVTGANGNTDVKGNLTVGTNKFIADAYSGDVTLNGTLDVTGSFTTLGSIETDGSITAAGLIMNGSSDFLGTATFASAVSFGGTSHAATSSNQVASLNTLYDGYSTNTATSIIVSLAQGREGQIKIIQAEDCNSGAVTVRPFQMAGGTDVLLNADRETVALVWCSTKWRVVFTSGTII